MRLLSFKRKSKKNNAEASESGHSIPELDLERCSPKNEAGSSNSSSVNFHSPIADLFMVASSIPDVTNNNLLDEILNELPASDKIQCPSTIDKDQSLEKNDNHSLKLEPASDMKANKSDACNYCPEIYPTIYSKVNNSLADNLYRTTFNHNIATDKKINGQNIVYTFETPNSERLLDSSSIAYSKSESSSSISSLSSTEEFIPLHHISRSDPHPIFPENHDTTPLIELIPRSLELNTTKAPNYNENRKLTSDRLFFPLNNTKSTIQRSPGFVIDRMKERHRQECRKSWQDSLTVSETKIMQPVRRAGSLLTSNHNSRSIALNIQQQKIFQRHQQQIPILDGRFAQQSPQRVTAVPAISRSSQLFPNNNILPVKSYSAVNNGQQRRPIIASESQPHQWRIMKPILEIPPISESLPSPNFRKPYIETPSRKKESEGKTNFIKCANEDGVTKKSVVHPNYGGDGKTVFNGYTNPTCHNNAKQVTQPHHTSSLVSKQKKVSTTVNISNLEPAQQSYEDGDNATMLRALTTEEESTKHLNNILQNQMGGNSKLKVEYQRMQIIHATRSYSVPEFTRLLDDTEDNTGETQRRKSMENNEKLVTIPVELIPTYGDLKQEEITRVKVDDKKSCHNPKRSHCCPRPDNISYNCYHQVISAHKGHTHNCCKQIRYVQSTCCKVSHTHNCKFSSRKASASSKTKAPPKKDITITSPSASKPHVVQNIEYSNLRIDGKKLNLYDLRRPVCQTCRH